MLPHPETECRITDFRRQDTLCEAASYRLVRSAAPAPIHPLVTKLIRAAVASLVARPRACRAAPRRAKTVKAQTHA